MSISQQSLVPTDILPTAGEVVAQLTALKDTVTQANETKILNKYPSVITGIQAQTAALKDTFTCNLASEQIAELQPVLEKFGYTVTKTVNATTGKSTVTIQWKNSSSTVEFTGVSPNNLELYVDYPYSTTFYPQGGTAPYKFKLKEGLLPQGLTLAKTDTTLALTGTPTLTGVDYMVIETIDATGATKTTTVQWAVRAVVTVEKPQPVIVEIKMDYINGTVPLTSKGKVGDKVGQVAADSNYIYYCTATYVTQMVQPDIWKRVALNGSTWG